MVRTLVLRRSRGGGVRVEGGRAPNPHTLSARFIAREIESGLVRVQVTLDVEGGPLTYELVGFEDHEPGKPNFTAWRCRLVEEAADRG